MFQVFKVSNEFFSFEIAITLKTERHKFIEIPGITLCPTYLEELKMNERKNFTALEMFKLTRNMTQMSKEDFRCWILELLTVNGTKYRGQFECSDLFRVVESTTSSYGLKCFTFFSQLELKSWDQRVFNAINENSIIKFLFKSNNYTKLTRFAMHSPFMVPALHTTDFVNLESGKRYQIFFAKTITHSLKYPHKSNCSDYGIETSMKFPSQWKCYQNCVSGFRKKSCGCLTNQLDDSFLLDEITPNDRFCKNFDAFKGDCLKSDSDEELFEFCNKICPVGCIEDHYNYVISNINYHSDDIKIQITHSTSSKDTIVKHAPNMSTSVYFANLGGIAGLWLGLSILTLYDYCEKIVKFLQKKIAHRLNRSLNRRLNKIVSIWK
jgi:hypothetical protein